MKKIFFIILILFLAGGVGLYFGLANNNVRVSVYESDGNASLAAVLAGQAKTDFIVKGNQLYSDNFFKNFLGENFKANLPNLPWLISRASAVTAFLLMFFIIFLGVGITTGFIYRIINPVEAWAIHRNISLSLGVSILIHVFSLLFDKFMNFKIWDILIPFASNFKPLYLNLGIVGFYILLLIILNSLLFKLKAPKSWRTLHYLVYPLFIFSFVHALFIGTDSKTLAMTIIYWSTGVIFIFLISYRLVYNYLKNRSLDRKISRLSIRPDFSK